MTAIIAFLAGFFIFNAIPHLVKGIAGDKHMTPFKRVSSPHLNIFWSFANLVIGVLLLGFDTQGRLNFPSGTNFWIFLLGGFLLSLTAAKLFDGPNARLPWHKN